MAGYDYTTGVSGGSGLSAGGAGGGLSSGSGAQGGFNYAQAPYGQQTNSNTQIQAGGGQGTPPTTPPNPYANYLTPSINNNNGTYSPNSWFGGINPSYVTDGSLNNTYSKDPYLSGLQDYQINSLNTGLGGHTLNSSWNFDGGNNNMHYGYQPGNSSYLGDYLQIGSNYYNPDQYQGAIDAYNGKVNGINTQNTNLYGANYTINGQGPLAQANTIQDVISGYQQPAFGPAATNPYVNNQFAVTNSGNNYGGGLRS